MIGQTISHYRITKKLGEGGMGVVYRAEDTKLKRDVALKFLAPELMRDDLAKARFMQEAQAAAALHHPNICTVFEIDEADGHTFIAMACIEGRTLHREIQAGPLKLDDALDRAVQMAEGLRAAHAGGIVHRDIKPANVMITTGGQVLITDFGLALAPNRTKLTLVNTTLGTFAYMSPEQSRGGDVDHRTDIWSLGVVLYEMISGRKPFRGEHQQAVVHAMLNEEPDPLTGLRTGVPMELERITGKALTKDPANRYQHMDDLLVDLQAVRRQLGDDSVSSGAPTATLGGTMAAPPASRRPGTLIGGIAAAVVVAAVLLFGLNIGGMRDRMSGPGGQAPIRSLAVLPFDNMMGDAEQDFFVEGLHESLITELSKIGSLRVISRTSAMYYQNTSMPLTEIARQLDVDALVEGSVLRVGDRVRITAQLIRGDNDEHIWAEDYDRDLKDVLNLLSEMAGMIAGEIDVAVSPGQREGLTTDRTVDPEVYELVLRGLHHMNRFNYEDALEARRYFEQAAVADPEYATAYAMLSGSHIILSVLGDFPSDEIYPPARAAALKALELNPDHGGAHTALGFIKLYYDWDWDAADREFARALELNPNDAYAMHGQSDVLTVHGRVDEALDQVRLARRLDPLSYIRNVVVWGHLYMARRYEESLAEIEQWREFSGNPGISWYNAFNAYNHLGRYDEAMAELRYSSTGQDPEFAPLMEAAYAESGIPGACLVCANRLADLAREEYLDPLAIALYYARAGAGDEVFVWLEKGYEDRLSGIHTFGQPDLDPYRQDPRFVDLMRRIGIPEEALGGD